MWDCDQKHLKTLSELLWAIKRHEQKVNIAILAVLGVSQKNLLVHKQYMGKFNRTLRRWGSGEGVQHVRYGQDKIPPSVSALVRHIGYKT